MSDVALLQAQCSRLRCKSIAIRVSGIVLLGMRAQAFPGTSFSLALSYNRLARFHDFRFARTRSKSLWRYSPALVFRLPISWQAQHFERFACRCNAIFRDRRSTLEICAQISRQAQLLRLFVQISWQAQYFPACAQISWQAQHFEGSSCSRCGVARMWRLPSEPSADFGWVESLLLWRGAHFEVNPLRALGGSNRSRCGAAHILRLQSEPSACFGWVESLLLWRGAHFELGKRTLCALWVGRIDLAVARRAF